ncbi:MAG TPA: hypothetical protein VMH86_01015 [Rhizomicrobium sp.]|nr:hypothetical protein [Rhizomicrobium sp.]
MIRRAVGAVALLAVSAFAAHADEVCKARLYLTGGSFNTNCTSACAITFSNPVNVGYITQWSYFTVSNVSVKYDRVEVQVDLLWSSIEMPGTNLVWLAGWPPQNLTLSDPRAIAFANGSGNFEGFNEPQGSQFSLDADGAIAPSGLAYITYSQPGQQPRNVRWSAMSTGEGRIRTSFWYITSHTALMNWLAVQSSGNIVCNL